MILTHLGNLPAVHETAFIAQTATICGCVKIGKNARIMYGATIIAEGGTIEIGDNCVVLENAVLRSTAAHSLSIGNDVLIGPHAHVVGCTIEDNVFIATGATVFHGARLCKSSEVSVNGVVHIQTILPEKASVPIGWIAVGAPAQIFPPEKHEEIWDIQKELNFPKFVYNVDRDKSEGSIMPMKEIMNKMTVNLGSHKGNTIVE